MSSRLAVAGVAVLLLLTVGGANMVLTAERTALNGDYVSDTLESENVYESLTDEAQATIRTEIEDFSPENSQRVPNSFDVSYLDAQALAAESLPESYVRAQASQNVDRVFDYLHGERSEPGLRIDTDPLRANVSEAVSEQVEAADPVALLNDASFTVEGYEVDGALAREMYESRARYQAYRSDIRARTDAQQRDELNSDAKSDARARARQATGQYNQQITQGTITVQEAVIDGLTDDEMTYEEFQSAYDAGRSQLAEGVGQAAGEEIDSQVSTSDFVDAELESTLQDTRGYVQTIDTLQIALPVVALLLIALLYGITRAWRPTVDVTGRVLVVAGAIGLVAVLVQSVLLGIAEDRVGSQFQNSDVVGMDLLTNFVEGVFEALTIQSSVLVALGLVLVGLVYADENGYLDDVKRTIGIQPAPAGGSTANASSQYRQQPPREQPPQGQQPREQPEPQPRQPTGRSIARQGPQQSQSEHDRSAGDQPQQQPDEQPSDTAQHDQPDDAQSEADESQRERSSDGSQDQSAQEEPSAGSRSGHQQSDQASSRTESAADRGGHDVDDADEAESGSLDAWETSESAEDDQSE